MSVIQIQRLLSWVHSRPNPDSWLLVVSRYPSTFQVCCCGSIAVRIRWFLSWANTHPNSTFVLVGPWRSDLVVPGKSWAGSRQGFRSLRIRHPFRLPGANHKRNASTLNPVLYTGFLELRKCKVKDHFETPYKITNSSRIMPLKLLQARGETPRSCRSFPHGTLQRTFQKPHKVARRGFSTACRGPVLFLGFMEFRDSG